MRVRNALCAAVLGTAFAASGVSAQATMNSPAGGTLPPGVSIVGGIVTDLIGLNGNRVVSQLAASSLFVGFACMSSSGISSGCPGSPSDWDNPLLVGTQTGFDAAVLSALGGGISEAAFRFTLFDGDHAAGDFDFNDNTLLVNGLDFGNWSTIPTTITNSTGGVLGSATGFPNDQLATGFFSSNNAGLLTSLFASMLLSESLAFELTDDDPGDNFYDFTRGIDASLIDVGTPPVVTPPTVTPEPLSLVLLGTGLAGVAAVRRRRHQLLEHEE